jgi:hypothetical protein
MVSYSLYNRPSPTPKQLAKPARDLPLHYTILISAFSVAVHWIASQSFFLMSVQVLDYPQGRNDRNNLDVYGGLSVNAGLYVDAGFSPIAIVFTLIVGGGAFVVLVAMGLRRYSRY